MAKFKHVGKTLTAMKAANKGGLVENLILSKLEAANILHLKQEYVDDDGKPVEPSVTEYLEREAVGIKNTLINFLTSSKLNWTVAELKASLEVEEFISAAPLNTKVDTTVNTTVAPGIPTAGGPSSQTTTGPGSGTGTGAGFVTEPLQMNKNGGKHGGRLKAIGHAYVGEPDIVPNSDTTDPENEFTRVRLYKDKIPKELL